MATWDELTARLDAAVVSHVSDSVVYTAGGGSPITIQCFVDYKSNERTFSTSDVVQFDPSITVRKSDIPAIDVEQDTFVLPHEAGAWKPNAVRSDESGRWWVMELYQD